MADDIHNLVLSPFREIVSKGNQALQNATEADSQAMLKAARGLVNNAERALNKVEPICQRQLDEYQASFIDALKENDDISGFRELLNDMLWDLDDCIEVDSFDIEIYSKLQALLRTAALKISDIVVRMKLEYPGSRTEMPPSSERATTPSVIVSPTSSSASGIEARNGPVEGWEEGETAENATIPGESAQESAQESSFEPPAIRLEDMPPEPPENPWSGNAAADPTLVVNALSTEDEEVRRRLQISTGQHQREPDELVSPLTPDYEAASRNPFTDRPVSAISLADNIISPMDDDPRNSFSLLSIQDAPPSETTAAADPSNNHPPPPRLLQTFSYEVEPSLILSPTSTIPNPDIPQPVPVPDPLPSADPGAGQMALDATPRLTPLDDPESGDYHPEPEHYDPDSENYHPQSEHYHPGAEHYHPVQPVQHFFTPSQIITSEQYPLVVTAIDTFAGTSLPPPTSNTSVSPHHPDDSYYYGPGYHPHETSYHNNRSAFRVDDILDGDGGGPNDSSSTAEGTTTYKSVMFGVSFSSGSGSGGGGGGLGSVFSRISAKGLGLRRLSSTNSPGAIQTTTATAAGNGGFVDWSGSAASEEPPPDSPSGSYFYNNNTGGRSTRSPRPSLY